MVGKIVYCVENNIDSKDWKMKIWQDIKTGAIYQGEEELEKLTPLGRKLLCYFLRYQKVYLTKDEIISAVWEGNRRGVSDDALYRQVYYLRQILKNGHAHIQTWRGLPGGYRFHPKL